MKPGVGVGSLTSLRHCDIFNLCMGRRTNKLTYKRPTVFEGRFTAGTDFLHILAPAPPSQIFFENFFACDACLTTNFVCNVMYYTFYFNLIALFCSSA